jgi:hypothetical protein
MEPLALWRDWHHGIEAIYRNKQLPKVWKEDWKPKQKKNSSHMKVVIDAIREGRNVEGVHEIITSLAILQGKCSICTLNERVNSQKKCNTCRKLLALVNNL